MLTRDREFVAFKGFPVCVTTSEPLKKKDGPTKFEGTLYDRTEDTVGVSMLNHAASNRGLACGSAALVIGV